MSRLKLIIQISAILLVGITQSLAQSAPPRDEMILRPDAGREIGRIYQAWLTPLQQGGLNDRRQTAKSPNRCQFGLCLGSLGAG